MGLISRSIPSLFNGVSQQPAQLRNPSQCESMVNAYPAISTGLRKRPPTQHLAKLRNSDATDAFVHAINRDSSQRYIVIILNGDLEVYTLDGTPCTVSFPSGKAYLSATTPRDSFACVTIGDYTLVLNRTVTVAMNAATAAGSITGTKQTFGSLPAATGSGNIYEITGDPSNQFDNYYVKDTASGIWTEWLRPGITYNLNAATMPWKLTRTGATTFTFDVAVWDDRTVGDNTSNPIPSFVGKSIKDLFLYRNRLGLLAEENIVLSRPGALFNFWTETATAVLDTDPIDHKITHTRISVLNYAVVFHSTLMLFSDLTQFQLSGADVLTPRTVKVDPATEFEASNICRPVTAGQEVFFAQTRGAYSAIRDYYVDQTTATNDAADVTAHVPSYVPDQVFKIAASTSEDVLFALTLSERNAVYVYKYYWAKDEKVQSAWGKFTFEATDTILGCEFINHKAYFVIQRSDGVYLESMNLQSNLIDSPVIGFLVHLDRKTSIVGVYDAANNWTTWTLPYSDSGPMRVVVGDGFSSLVNGRYVGQAGAVLTTTRPTATTIRAAGDWSAHACYVGRDYSMRYRFSELYLKDGQNVAITSGTLKLRRMILSFALSGYFRVEVTPKYRSTYSYPFTGKVLGSSGLVVGAPGLDFGEFRFPLMSDNKGCIIEIVNDSPFPSVFQSAEWEAEYTAKSQRV